MSIENVASRKRLLHFSADGTKSWQVGQPSLTGLWKDCPLSAR